MGEINFCTFDNEAREKEFILIKKIVTLLLTFALLLSLVACGGGDGEKNISTDEKTPGSQEQVTDSITEQEDAASETEKQQDSSDGTTPQQENTSEEAQQPEDTSGDISDGEENVFVAPKSPDDPAPLVERKVEGLTQEQVSEVCKFIYFTMGVPYEEMDKRIPDENILYYWGELETFIEMDINPYEGLELYFVEKNHIEWPVADYITEGTKYTGSGNVVKMDNPYTEEEYGYDCWRVYIDVASVDEVAAYINVLKKEGFAFTSFMLNPEEPAPGNFNFLGEYEWQGVAQDGRCIQFLHTQEPTTEFTGEGSVQLIIILYSQNPNG